MFLFYFFKDGLSLKDIALQTGNEEIINLIFGVHESMVSKVFFIGIKEHFYICELFQMKFNIYFETSYPIFIFLFICYYY